MNDGKINIEPLKRDEANQLHGGYGIIKAKTGLNVENTNTNCDSKLTTGDLNTNCNGCSCGSGGGPVHIDFHCTDPIDKPNEP